VTSSLFRLVCGPAVLTNAPAGWATEMLRDGEVAIVPDAEGLASIHAVARALDATAIAVVRGEADAATQERTVMAHAGTLALVWVAPGFSDDARAWAQKRAPMTLLIESDGELAQDERRRVERFVAILSGQAA
jgi:hypothetical protein